jgi:hypothetical protein
MSTDPDQHSVVEFHHGQVPTIACINRTNSSAFGEVKWSDLIPELQKFVNVFARVWGTPAKIIPATEIPSGCWWMLFLEEPDADAQTARDLGYHDLTPDGLPLSKVFVKTTRDAGQKVSVTASHELAEMLVDPGMQLGAIGPDGQTWYAYEVADAVEGEEIPEFPNIPMSNFVYPAWFEAFRAPGSKFDHKGTCTKPFELRPGGYMPVFKNGHWTRILGPEEGGRRPFNPAIHPRMQARPQQMRRKHIREAQEQLYKLGFYKGRIDGIDGPKTEEALQKYQNEHKVTPGLAATLFAKIWWPPPPPG